MKKINIAYGCKNGAPSSLSSRSQSSQSGSPKHCSVCGVAVKDHLGPHGPAECLVKLIESLSQRVERLENVNQRQADELQLQSRLHVERQEAFLTTIEALDERVASLEQEVAVLERASAERTAVLERASAERTVVATGSPDSCSPGASSLVSELRSADVDTSIPTDGEATASAKGGGESTLDEAGSGASPACSEPGDADCANAATVVDRRPDYGVEDAAVVVHAGRSLSWAGTVARANASSGLNQERGGFQLIGKNGRPVRHASKDKRSAGISVKQRGHLKGAVRVHCMPFHLSGISLSPMLMTSSPTVAARRSPLLDATSSACPFGPRRQSAKIYIDKESKENVLDESFWPTHLKCRVWEPEAPSSKRALSDPLPWLE